MAIKIQQFDEVTEYKIKIADGGEFLFDTGDATGTLTINGNLNVQGETTTVGSSDLVVSDNTITVNDGESGAGVSLNTAGLIVDRGTLANAEFLFDERVNTIDSSGNDATPGAFLFQDTDGDLRGIHTASIKTKDNQNLYFLGENTTGILSVTGTVDYEKQVFPYTGTEITNNQSNTDRLVNPVDDDIIPNIKSVKDYVRDYHKYNFQDKIAALTDSDTFVVAFDADDPGQPISKIEITIDNQTNAVFKQSSAQFYDITIQENKITSTNTNQDLILEANGSGVIQTSFPVEIEKTTDPTAPADGIRLYAKDEADGGTGLFFVNENSTTDELISRNKALLYSIIF